LSHVGYEGIKDNDTERALMRLNGLSQEQMDELEAQAGEISKKYPAQPYANSLENLREARLMVSDPVATKMIAEQQANSATVLGIAKRDVKAGASLARFVQKGTETSLERHEGETDVDFARRYVELNRSYTAGIATSNAQLQSGTQIFGAIRKAGSPSRAFDNTAIAQSIHLNIERGGMAGEDVRTFTNDLYASSLAKKSKKKLSEAGLRNADGTAKQDTVDEAFQNPYKFSYEVIGPMLSRMGIDLHNPGAVKSALVEKLGFRPRGAELPALAIAQGETLKRIASESAKVRANMTPENIQSISADSLQNATDGVIEQFKQATDRVTKEFHKPAAEALTGVSDWLRSLGRDAEKKQHLAKELGYKGNIDDFDKSPEFKKHDAKLGASNFSQYAKDSGYGKYWWFKTTSDTEKALKYQGDMADIDASEMKRRKGASDAAMPGPGAHDLPKIANWEDMPWAEGYKTVMAGNAAVSTSIAKDMTDAVTGMSTTLRDAVASGGKDAAAEMRSAIGSININITTSSIPHSGNTGTNVAGGP
jgi:hypothetical protein